MGHAKSVARAARDNGFCATLQGDADNATANLLALLELWPSWRLPRVLVLAGEARARSRTTCFRLLRLVSGQPGGRSMGLVNKGEPRCHHQLP